MTHACPDRAIVKMSQAQSFNPSRSAKYSSKFEIKEIHAQI